MTEITALLSSVAPGAIRAPAGIAAAPDFSLLLAGVLLPATGAPGERQPLADSGKALPVALEASATPAPTTARLIADPAALDLVPPAPPEDGAPPARHPRSDPADQPQSAPAGPIAVIGIPIARPVARDVACPADTDTIEPLGQDSPDPKQDDPDPTTPTPLATSIGQPALLPVPAPLPTAPPTAIAPIEPAAIETAGPSGALASAEAQGTPGTARDTQAAVLTNTTSPAPASMSEATPPTQSDGAQPQGVTAKAVHAAPLRESLARTEPRAASNRLPPFGTPAKAGVQVPDRTLDDTSVPRRTQATAGGPALSRVRTDESAVLVKIKQPHAAALPAAAPTTPTQPEPAALREPAASAHAVSLSESASLPEARATAVAPFLIRTPAKAGVQASAVSTYNTGLPSWTPASAGVRAGPDGVTDAAAAVAADAVPLARATVPEAVATPAPTRQTVSEAPDHSPRIPTVAVPPAAAKPESIVRARPEPTPPRQPAAPSPIPPPTPSPLPAATGMPPILPDAAPDVRSSARPDHIAAPLVAPDPAKILRPAIILPVEGMAAIPPDTAPAASPQPAVATAPAAPPASAASPIPTLPSAPPVLASVAPTSPLRPEPAIAPIITEPARTPAPALRDAAGELSTPLPTPMSAPAQRIDPVAIPASQAFASAVFAAVETARAKPAPRGNIAELAMIAGIDLSAPASTGSVVAATPAPTLDTGRGEWLDGMIDRIEMLTAATGIDRRETRIRLNPDQLGSVEIAIERDGDTTHLRFTAETQAARTLLTEAAPRLAELADARGLKLGHTQVDLGGNAAQSNAQQHQRQPERDAEPNRTTPPVPAMADLEPAEPLHRLA